MRDTWMLRACQRSCLAALAVNAKIVSVGLAAPPAGSSRTWSDEFSGSSLDSTNRGSGIPASATTPSTRWTRSRWAAKLLIKTCTTSSTNYTGMIGTPSEFQQMHGAYEARIDVNGSPGMWSAFWIQSPTYGDSIRDVATAGAEIDVAMRRSSNAGSRGVRPESQTQVRRHGARHRHCRQAA